MKIVNAFMFDTLFRWTAKRGNEIDLIGQCGVTPRSFPGVSKNDPSHAIKNKAHLKDNSCCDYDDCHA